MISRLRRAGALTRKTLGEQQELIAAALIHHFYEGFDLDEFLIQVRALVEHWGPDLGWSLDLDEVEGD